MKKNSILISSIILLSLISPIAFAKDYPQDATFSFETFLYQPPADTLKDIPNTGLQTADMVAIKIWIDNPSKNPIVAARLWMNYPKDKIEGVDVLDPSDFNLMTPGENEIDTFNAVLKLGRGYTNGSLDKTKIHFATVVFQIRSETPNDIVTLTYHGFSSKKDSKVTIHVVDNYLPIRVLPATEPKPFSFKVNLIDVPAETIIIPDKEGGEETIIPGEITPPKNIIACSDGDEITFTWDLPEMDIDGFYVYYSPKQDTYLHRKTLPKVQAYSFTGFPLGSTYYFKVSSYKGTQESPQTEEFKVTVGQVPCQPVFSDLSDLTVLKTDIVDANIEDTIEKTPETGPNPLVLALLSIFVIGIVTTILSLRHQE